MGDFGVADPNNHIDIKPITSQAVVCTASARWRLTMNWAHIHLILTHIPVLGVLAGTVVLLVALLMRHPATVRAAWLFFIISGLAAIPVYFTGEPAEEMIEGLIGGSETIIEQHEQAGLYAFIGAGVLGALALGGTIVWWKAKQIPVPATLVVLVLAAGVSGLMTWTANLGGEIRHTEVRSTAPLASNAGQESSRQRASWSSDDDHDDDRDND